MPKTKRPRCIGFPTSFSLPKWICVRQKLNQALIDVSAQDWSSTKAMANATAKFVQNYAHECCHYWKNVSVEDFNTEYQDACNEIKEKSLRKDLVNVQKEIQLKGKLMAAQVVLDNLDSKNLPGTTVFTATGSVAITDEEETEVDAWDLVYREGEILQKKAEDGRTLSVKERNTMSVSLSHILDFIDDNDDGQNTIIGSSWDDLRTTYTNHFKMPVTNLCPELATAIETCHQLCMQNNDSDDAEAYLDWELSIIKIKILETIRTHKQIRSSLVQERMMETDILMTVWGPIIQRLCSMKSLSNIIGFKIDVRLVYDGQKHELDVSTGEIARNTNSEKKVLMDEGKDILDYLIQNATNNNAHEKLSCFMIQIAGIRGEVSSIRMVKLGKYVAVPQRKFIFPQNMLEIDKIAKMLEGLMLLVNEAEANARFYIKIIQNTSDRRSSLGGVFNRGEETGSGTSWAEEIPDTCMPNRNSWYAKLRNHHISN
ncbi:hypothetical protein BDC45DRAFT_575872 [Circinella umbellata]|nr:hypothetical protein BDC45DRAFT_575872 [Circinella umbellata]